VFFGTPPMVIEFPALAIGQVLVLAAHDMQVPKHSISDL
jgi:hypothetical protein